MINFQELYSNFENLALLARSEKIGCAVNPAASGTGMMEYWNGGAMGLAQ